MTWCCSLFAVHSIPLLKPLLHHPQHQASGMFQIQGREPQDSKAGADTHNASQNTRERHTRSPGQQENTFAISYFIDVFFTSTLVNGTQHKSLEHTEARQTLSKQGAHMVITSTPTGAPSTHSHTVLLDSASPWDCPCFAEFATASPHPSCWHSCFCRSDYITMDTSKQTHNKQAHKNTHWCNNMHYTCWTLFDFFQCVFGQFCHKILCNGRHTRQAIHCRYVSLWFPVP